ncbi:MAG: hypothetical protein J5544_06010 [Clostridia bacterium]|nr:hypothetical protein [Clostridia bacterium]
MKKKKEKTMMAETIVIEGSRGDAPWEGCINSVNYRIERGRPVEVPKEVAELIRAGEAEKRTSARMLEKYTSAEGMRL